MRMRDDREAGATASRSGEEQRLRDLTLLRRVRDRMDREYAQPLDVAALARGVNMSAGHCLVSLSSPTASRPTRT